MEFDVELKRAQPKIETARCGEAEPRLTSGGKAVNPNLRDPK